MKKFLLALLLLLPLLAHAQARSSCAYTTAPAGATALGVTNQYLCVQPTLSSVSPTGASGNYQLFGCLPYQSACATSAFVDSANSGTILTLSQQSGNNGPQLVSFPAGQGPGGTPTLPGNVPWYVESCITTTNNAALNWPAFWLMPVEHNNAGSDHSTGYVEIDVFEQYCGVNDCTTQTSPQATAINWAWGGSSYTKISQTSNYANGPSTNYSTAPHCLGVAYNSVGPSLTFYQDDSVIETITSSQITEGLQALHYLMLWTNQTAGSGQSGYEIQVNSYRLYMNPLVVIGGKPASGTTSTSAAFTFTTPSTGNIYCQLDGGTLSTAECTTLGSITGLSVGTHTVNAVLYQTPSVTGTSVSPYYVDATYTWTISAGTGTTTATFTAAADTSLLPGPERGYAFQTVIDMGSDFTAPSLNTSDPMGGSRLVVCPLELGVFVGGAIPTSVLNSIAANFNTLRTAGFQCIFEPRYTGYSPTYTDITTHAANLTATMYAYGDVVPYANLGFIGYEGLWQNSAQSGAGALTCGGSSPQTCPNATVTANQAAARDAILSMFYPYTRIGAPLSELVLNWWGTPISNAGYSGSNQSRTGFFNACPLNTSGASSYSVPNNIQDGGFFTDLLGLGESVAALAGYAQTAAEYVGYIGAFNNQCSMNGTTTSAAYADTGCADALAYLQAFHGMAFDFTDGSSYSAAWSSGGCLTQIMNFTGYRIQYDTFVLPTSITHAAPFTSTLTLQNVGWGRVASPRSVVAVFVDQTTQAQTLCRSRVDLRQLPDQAMTPFTISFVNCQVPLAHTYALYLGMPSAFSPASLNPGLSLPPANATNGSQSYSATTGLWNTGLTFTAN